jgi:hypothetical protein
MKGRSQRTASALVPRLRIAGFQTVSTLFRRYPHIEEGIGTVGLALAALTNAPLLQLIAALWSGSGALLADTKQPRRG